MKEDYSVKRSDQIDRPETQYFPTVWTSFRLEFFG